MASVSGLMPARFLCLVAHLVITIMILWSREDNVRACLSREYTMNEFEAKDTELIIGLAISLGLFLIEFIGFFAGLSMFSYTQNAFSAILHAGAGIALVFFIFDLQCADDFWYIFAVCSVLPAILEVSTIVGVTCLKRGA